MPVRFSVAPLFPGHSESVTDTGTPADDAAGAPGARPNPAWTGDQLELLVTPHDAGLNRDRSAVRLHKKASPTHTLTLDEIVAAPAERRTELLRRFRDLLATKAGPSEALDVERQSLTIEDGPWTVTAGSGAIKFVVQPAPGERYELNIDVSNPTRPRVTLEPDSPERGAGLAFLLEAFQQLLVKPARFARTIDPKAGQLFELLLGPGGIMNPQDRQRLPPSQRFLNAKLFAWDFNSTVGDGRGSFRPDMRDVTDNLNRMGAVSVITTTIDPQPIEKLLAKANIHFNAFFGGQEVRQYPKNKHYQELAKTYGFDAGAARAQMVVIGDSKTDIPSDMPGVLFINNDDETPAEVLQLLLHRLDELGDGDFARGLTAAAGDGLQPGERRMVDMSPISFAVELRDGANDGDPSLVPTIHDVRVDLDDGELERLLSKPPDATQLDQGALYELGFRYLECIIPEERLPDTLRCLSNVPDQKSLVAAGQYRLAQRRGLVEAARGMAKQLLVEPDQLPKKRLLGLTQALAAVGDSEVAADLAAYAQKFLRLNAASRSAALGKLAEDRDQLRALLNRTRGAQGAGSDPRRAGGDATTEAAYFGKNARAMAKLFKRAAESPLSSSDKARTNLLETLAEFLKKPFPGMEDYFSAMTQQLDSSFDEATAKLEELFAEREAGAGDLADPVALAAQRAPVSEQLWSEIDAVWNGLVAAQR